MKLHIVMVMDIPFDTGSWIGRYMPLAKQLAKRGYRVSILMPNHDLKKQSYYLDKTNNIVIYETGIPFFKKIDIGRKNYSTFFLCSIGIKNILRSLRLILCLNPDLIMVCKPLPIASVVGLIFKACKRRMIILDCDDAEVAINSVRSNLQRRIIHIFESLLPRLADLVLVNSEFTRKRILELGVNANRINYIPNGVETDRFANLVIKPEFRNELGNNKIVLYYGDLSFASGHNIDILLNAFKILITKISEARLLIIGDGKDEVILRRMADQLGISDKTIWVGRITPEEVPSFLAVSDVVVDPVKNVLSNLARCPVKIIEAMYLGKPVVTSDIGERRNLLGDFGFYAKDGDVYSLADKILQVIQGEGIDRNKDLLIKRASEYSWEKLGEKVDVVIKERLAK